MKILFLCTAHNSLSQRLYLSLLPLHDITIEYALSREGMIEAVELARPHLIICPFLTVRVPKEIYTHYMTLIVNPGPPGDTGPSALDWVILGDDGTVENSDVLRQNLDKEVCRNGRSHWGVTILQAVEEFDAEPVWAFEQFELDIDQPGLTKSTLYRGPISQAAVRATTTALDRIEAAASALPIHELNFINVKASPAYHLSIKDQLLFLGGNTYTRPLLKAAHRDFDVKRHSSQQISRRIRCADSQPGVLSQVFGPSLYVYGGIVESCIRQSDRDRFPGSIIATRDQAICIATCDGRGVWITHIRPLKRKVDIAICPKIPAVIGLLGLELIDAGKVEQLQWDLPKDWAISKTLTFQEIWINFTDDGGSRTAYLYFDFYNGAISTLQCSQLIRAMDFILSAQSAEVPVRALVLMGGSYFSNGIALNVIEANVSPSKESFLNTSRMDDVVDYILQEFPSKNILTIAGMRGNAAAGGVALAAACDVVIAGEDIVLNPAYRSLGLSGSEYHSLSYRGRCGTKKAAEILRSMIPISASYARSIGLVDHVLPGTGGALEERIYHQVSSVLRSCKPGSVPWKVTLDLSPASLAHIRAYELDEMSKDFYSLRAMRYHTRRFDFIRKVPPTQTPLRFAAHRRVHGKYFDEEECDSFDEFEHFENIRQTTALEQLLGKILEVSIPEIFHQAISRLQDAALQRKSTQTVAVVPEFPSYYTIDELNDSPAQDANRRD